MRVRLGVDQSRSPNQTVGVDTPRTGVDMDLVRDIEMDTGLWNSYLQVESVRLKLRE